MHPRGVGVEERGVGAAPARPCWRGEGSGATGCSRLAALQSRAESLEGRTVSSSFVSSVPTQSRGSLCTQKGATGPCLAFLTMTPGL